MTDVLGLTTIATLYQAGNGIYEQFDKILVLDEGKQIFYGPCEDAMPFMAELGFLCEPAANKADFLTSVTVPTERAIVPGYEQKFPRSATEIRDVYEGSVIKKNMIAELCYPQSDEAAKHTTCFKEIVNAEKNPRLPKRSAASAGFPYQVKVVVTRQFQILWGDKPTLFFKQGSATIQAYVHKPHYSNTD
jgi:ATP-binding cassette subfamily G (WHITE) protein 2 (SNQ2)